MLILYLMIPVLFVLYFILEYFSHTKQLDLISKLKISGPLGPLAGTLLGIIPQCGMSVFVTTMFLSRRVTLGTLVATYLATSDEALPVLIAHRGEEMMILYIVGLKLLIGIVSGYAVDLLFGNKLYDGPLPEVKSSHAVEIKHELGRNQIQGNCFSYTEAHTENLFLGFINYHRDLVCFVLYRFRTSHKINTDTSQFSNYCSSHLWFNSKLCSIHCNSRSLFTHGFVNWGNSCRIKYRCRLWSDCFI